MSMPVTRPAAAIAVRDAVAGDVPAIREIYACHVRYGFVSFEKVPPDEAEMERRRQEVLLRKLPYLVIEREGQVCGFAYASPFGPRPACRYTVEDSVYIAPGTLGQGFGRWALAELINRCTALDLSQMVAVIGDGGNSSAIRLHQALGFARASVLRAVGFKLGHWVDGVILQRRLGVGDAAPPALREPEPVK